MDDEEVVRLCAQRDGSSLRCLDLDEASVAGLRVVASGAAREECEVVVVAREHLAETTDEVAVGRERTSWKRCFEFGDESVEPLHDRRELVDRSVHRKRDGT